MSKEQTHVIYFPSDLLLPFRQLGLAGKLGDYPALTSILEKAYTSCCVTQEVSYQSHFKYSSTRINTQMWRASQAQGGAQRGALYLFCSECKKVLKGLKGKLHGLLDLKPHFCCKWSQRTGKPKLLPHLIWIMLCLFRRNLLCLTTPRQNFSKAKANCKCSVKKAKPFGFLDIDGVIH